MVTFVYVLILMSASNGDLHFTGEGHFAEQAQCEKAAAKWQAAIKDDLTKALCVPTRW